MKKVDRILQNMRIAQAEKFIRDGDRLLDLGCFDRVLLERVAPRVKRAVGIDPLATHYKHGNVEVLKAAIPGDHPFHAAEFDCITMLAVLEHIIDKQSLASECFRLLAPAGRVVITVPHPRVDNILEVLHKLRIIDGMSLEEHHGYDIRETPSIFTGAGLKLHTRRSFELGLNWLFVFEKPATVAQQIEPRPTPQPAHA